MQTLFIKSDLPTVAINWKRSYHFLLLFILPLLGFGQGIFEYENPTETLWNAPKLPLDAQEQLGPEHYYFSIFHPNAWRNLFYRDFQGGDPTDFITFGTNEDYLIGQDLKFKISVFKRTDEVVNIGVKAIMTYTGVDHKRDGRDPMRSGYQDKMIFSIEPANPLLKVQQFLPGTANRSVSYSISSGWNASVGFDVSAGVEGSPEGPSAGVSGGISGSVGYNYSITSGVDQKDFVLKASRGKPQKVTWAANMGNVYSTLDNAGHFYTKPDDIIDYNIFTKWLKRPADMAISSAKFNYFVGYEANYNQVQNENLVLHFESEQRTQHSEVVGREGADNALLGGELFNTPSVFKIKGKILINIANQTASVVFDDVGPASIQNSQPSGLIASDNITAISNINEINQLEEQGMSFSPQSDVSITGDITQNRSELTIEAWVNNSSLENELQAIVSATGLEFVHFQTSDIATAQNAVYLTDGSSLTLPIIPKLSPGWHHVALSVKSGDSKVFVDGQQLGNTNTTSFHGIKSTANFTIGKGYAGGRVFEGKIANVRIWDYAKSRDELSAHSLDFAMNNDPHLLYFSPTSNSLDIYDSRHALSIPGSATGDMERVTIEAWVNVIPSLTGIHAIVSSSGSDFVHLQAAERSNVNSVVYLGDGRVIYLPAIPTLSPGWHHIALVAESGNSRIYIDGEQLGSADGSVFNSIKGSNSVFIGQGWSNERPLNGAIADVRIWKNRALTQQQISQSRYTPPTGSPFGLIYHLK